MPKGEISFLDFIVIEYGYVEETQLRVVCAADVGNTDTCLILTQSQQDRVVKNRRGRKLYKWGIDEQEVEEKQQESQEHMVKHAERFSELLKIIDETEN